MERVIGNSTKKVNYLERRFYCRGINGHGVSVVRRFLELSDSSAAIGSCREGGAK
jgi:hypothetical protein